MPQLNIGQLRNSKLQAFQKKRRRILQRYSRTGKRFASKYIKQFSKHALVGDNPRVNENPTWIEKFIENYLCKHHIKYEKEYEIYERYYDFYLPELNLLIEAHGDYYHGNPLIYNRENGKKSNLMVINNRMNDVYKRISAKSKNISLAAIFESAMTEYNITKVLDHFRNKTTQEWEYYEILE